MHVNTFQDNKNTSESVLSGKRIRRASTKSKEEDKPIWKNRTQYIIYFLSYCIDLRTLTHMLYEDERNNPPVVPSVFQLIIAAVCMGGPLVFIQVFIGQFARKGCTAIGSMLPATYGFGYTMLIINLYKSLVTLYNVSPGASYVLSSLTNYNDLPWMLCDSVLIAQDPRCFSKWDIFACAPCTSRKEKCYDPKNNTFSAYLYMYTYGFEKNISITKMTKMGRPQAKSFTQFVCILLVSIFICSKRFKSIDMLLRMTVILSALSLIGGMVVFITYTRTNFSLATIFSFHHEALLQPTCWVTAFRRVTEILNISSGGHVFLGSYMNYETPSHYWVSRAMGYFLIYICLFHIHIHFAEGLLFCRLTTNTLGLHSVNDAIFVLYATELGITATPNLWTLIHFLTYFILGLTTLIMQIMLVNETLCAELKIASWHLYIKVSYCVIIFLFSIPLMTPGGHLIIDNIDLELKVVNCVAVCLIFIIMCLYGLQRMKDDIYYTLDLSPTWYMQACWMISSIVSVIILVIQGLQTGTDYEVFVLRSLMHVTLGAPVLIGFIYKVIQYFGRRNITGIFRASAEYGDPDPTIRLYRILYNRRLEVRYRRRIETCKHRCLLNSDMASKAVEREFVQLQHAVFDLHNNEEFKGEYNDVMAMLDTHIKVLSTYFDNTL